MKSPRGRVYTRRHQVDSEPPSSSSPLTQSGAAQEQEHVLSFSPLSWIISVFQWLFDKLCQLLLFLGGIINRLVPGYKRRRTLDRLRGIKMNAVDFNTWERAGRALDVLEGKTAWKEKVESPLYDFNTIEKRLRLLQGLQSIDDWNGIMLALRSGLLRKIGGISCSRLYTHSNVGTKRLIHDYIEEITSLMQALHKDDHPGLFGEAGTLEAVDAKIKFFKETQRVYGHTALLLSGGASLGMYHFGVIKALHQQGLLPRIISGASVGSLVAALVCVSRDDEIENLFIPGKLNLDAFSRHTKGVGGGSSMRRRWNRFIETGVFMDITVLEDCIRDNIGNLTFQEAYDRTGRVLNITVASVSRAEMPRLLNYLTSPNVLIWSAACASCALKGLYDSVTLMAKDSSGKIVSYHPYGQRWSDGSVEADLPMARLSELFNVNLFVVSQVNPHVAPFITSGNRKSFLSRVRYFIQSEIGHRLQQMSELDILPSLLVPLQPMFSQKYEGDITIVPDVTWRDMIRILENPSEEMRQECILHAERGTWPMVTWLRAMCQVELVLQHCVRSLRKHRSLMVSGFRRNASSNQLQRSIST